MNEKELKKWCEEARNDINSHPFDYFQKDKTKKGLICPFCGSGSGTSGTGMQTKDNIHFKCFNCGFYGDVVEMLQKTDNLVQYDVLNKYYKKGIPHKTKPIEIKEEVISEYTEDDCRQDIKYAQQHLSEGLFYFIGRGFTEEDCKYLGYGFIKNYYHPVVRAKIKSGKWTFKPTPRAIVPDDDNIQYLARLTRAPLSKEEESTSKLHMKEAPIYTPYMQKSLNNINRVAFIVEGEFDAGSFYAATKQNLAIGLKSINKIPNKEEKEDSKNFFYYLKTNKPSCVLIPCLDNDKNGAGQKAQDRLVQFLKENKMPYFIPSLLPDGIKDCNEFLQKDREGFKKWITSNISAAQKQNKEFLGMGKNKEQDQEVKTMPSFKYYNVDNKFFYFLQAFLKNEKELRLATGMNYLDACIGGGFAKGSLVNLGGQTGMCKTTFMLQLANSFASQGKDVLYISLEMAGEELIAKSLSCIMHQKAKEQGKDITYNAGNIQTYAEIQENKDRNEIQKSIYNDALGYYQTDITKHFYIAEGVHSISVNDIASLVRNHYEEFAIVPVVIVDYIQLLAPIYERGTDKQNMDYNVLTLKQIASGNYLENIVHKPSEDLKTVVFCINANNRASYGQTATEGSGRDTSALEYTSDYLLSLEPSKLKETKEKEKGQDIIEETRAALVKALDLKIIKARRKAPPKKEKMPSFLVYNGAYFSPQYVKEETTQVPEEKNNDWDYEDMFNKK